MKKIISVFLIGVMLLFSGCQMISSNMVENQPFDSLAKNSKDMDVQYIGSSVEHSIQIVPIIALGRNYADGKKVNLEDFTLKIEHAIDELNDFKQDIVMEKIYEEEEERRNLVVQAVETLIEELQILKDHLENSESRGVHGKVDAVANALAMLMSYMNENYKL